MNWTYNSILDNAEFKAELDKFNDLDNEIKVLKNETIPDLKNQAENLKKESLKSDSDVTWQDVEQANHDIEKEEYRVKQLEKGRINQNKITSQKRQEARELIIKEVKQKKLETLRDSVHAIESFVKAHNEIKVIDRYENMALRHSPSDLEWEPLKRNKSVNIMEIPNPTTSKVVWDLWIKRAKKTLIHEGVTIE